MKRRLPVVIERAIGHGEATRSKRANDFDRQIHRDLGRATSCMKGCNHCCYYPVSVTILEALSIYRWLVRHQLWGHQLKQKIKTASGKTWGLTPEVWLMTKTACPLLDDEGACTAYEARPFSCRVTYSAGDPAECDAHLLPMNEDQFSRVEAITAQYESEKKDLRSHRISATHLPLSSALLFAEKIAKEKLDIQDLGFELLKGAP